MNKYFYKVIIKNKFTKLMALVIAFICVIVTLQLRDDVQNLDVDDYIYMYKSDIINTRVDFMREHYYSKIDNPGMGTAEGAVAWMSYLKWRMKTDQEIIKMLQEADEVTPEFLEYQKRFKIIQELCEIEGAISVPNGDVPLEEAIPEEFEKYKDYLRLEELPFSFTNLAYSGQGTLDAQLTEAHDNFVRMAKIVFDKIENDSLELNAPSPFTFIARMFGEFNLTPILITLSIFLFSLGVVMKWKEENSYRLKTNINCSDTQLFGRYSICVIAVILSVLFVIVGAFFVAWGIKGDFSGLSTLMMCDSDNYNGFSNFNHDTEYLRMGLSKIFYDYVDYYGSFTMHSYKLINFKIFLLAAALLGFLKLCFYIILGAGIGFTFNNKVKMILAGVVMSSLTILGHLFLQPQGWNPFTVTSCWNITMGGYGMTWLNGVMLLAISIIILYALFLFIISKKDVE